MATRGIVMRRRGSAMIYTLIVFSALVALMSLSVDLGRAELAKTQLQSATDAAARAAVRGTADSTAITRAINVAAINPVDNTGLVLLSSDVQIGRWNNITKTFTQAGWNGTSWVMANNSRINAAKITAVRNASRGTAIPVLFSGVMGFGTVNLTATATAIGSESTVPPVALHRFNESSGTIASDSAYNPVVQDAYVATPANTSWTGGGLKFNSSTKAATTGAASNITNNLMTSNQFTVFGRVAPSSTSQTNATIVSVSDNSTSSNISVRQQADKLEFRMRTSGSGAGESTGTASITSASLFASGQTFCDFCATFDGKNLKLYTRPDYSSGVGTQTMVSTTRSGDLSTWSTTARLTFGNEDSNNCPFLGEVLHVGFYDSVMDTSQIASFFGDPDNIDFYPRRQRRRRRGGECGVGEVSIPPARASRPRIRGIDRAFREGHIRSDHRGREREALFSARAKSCDSRAC